MKPVVLISLLLVLSSSACKPKAPEQPSRPPTPSAAEDESEMRLHLSSQIETGGHRTQYNAYFEGPQLTEIKATAEESQGAVAKYYYHGARLLKYTHSARDDDATLIEFDQRGRVHRAMAGTRALAAEEIDAIRTRAQLLRSHALAQQAARMHGH